MTALRTYRVFAALALTIAIAAAIVLVVRARAGSGSQEPLRVVDYSSAACEGCGRVEQGSPVAPAATAVPQQAGAGGQVQSHFGRFLALTPAQLATLQVKLTFLGDQLRLVQSVGFTQAGNQLDFGAFPPFERSGNPDIDYGNDQFAAASFEASADELLALIGAASHVPAATDGETIDGIWLSFMMVAQSGGVTIGFEAVLAGDDAWQLMRRLRDALGAGSAGRGILDNTILQVCSTDRDGDGMGEACDPDPAGLDADGDGVTDPNDLCNDTPPGAPVGPDGCTQKECGDVNADGNVNSIDAALVLQIGAGLIPTLPNASSADTNRDGQTNSIDALLILQRGAGLVGSLSC